MPGNVRARRDADNEPAPLDALAALTRPPTFAGLQRITVRLDKLEWHADLRLTKVEEQCFWGMTGKEPRQRANRYGSTTVSLVNVHAHWDSFVEWMDRLGINPRRVDVAFDFEFDNWESCEATQWQLWHQLVMAHAPRAKFISYEEADENGCTYDTWNCALKYWGRPLTDDGKPIGKPRTPPARTAMVYQKRAVVLRVELRVYGRPNVAHFLPPLYKILDTDPHELWERHLRCRVYKPRKLARAMR